jgi:2-dehydropantoate 2-reductase
MATPVEIAVVGGTGAMGGLWAGRLASIGRTVAIVGRTEDTVARIRSDGLTLDDADNSSTLRPAATTDPSAIGPVDTVFVFVKGPQTAEAAAAMAPLVGSSTTVVTLQNGLGNADVLCEWVDPERLVVGVTYDGATMRGVGHVAHTGRGPSYVGPYRRDASMDRAEGVADLLRTAGFDTRATEGVETEIWRKLIHNSACLPVAALTGLRAAELVAPGPTVELIDELATEATAVARRLGHPIETDERIERIHTVLGAAGKGVVSMLADVMAHRPTEIDTINGAVVRAAASTSQDVPLHRAMIALIRGLESTWTRPD